MRTQSSNQFCRVLLLINVHIFDYPDPRLSGLFRVVPTSPDNRGSTVVGIVIRFLLLGLVCRVTVFFFEEWSLGLLSVFLTRGYGDS